MIQVNITSFLRNFIIILLSNLLIFYFLQRFIYNTLVFEKISFSIFLTFIILVYLKKISYKNFSIILIIYIVMILLLVNIDRSKSFYILYWVKNNNITVLNGEINNLNQFKDINTIINKNDFTTRISEHKSRGLIIEQNNSLKLTRAGELILKLAESLAKIFNLKGWIGF